MKDVSNSLPIIKEDAIVISGISGLFPNADNILELSEKLYNKVDMVTGDLYPEIKHPELPQHYGKINDITKFDSQFFRVTPKQSESFEPCGRKIMEQAYSAIFDAGVNPETLKGTKLGVFVGFSQSDTVVSLFRSFVSNGFIISGCSKTMLANRVSYWIDAKGPSFGLDFGCASSMACLEIACERLIGGDCDAALVAGCSYNNKPVLSINMKRAGLLCLDGKTKCFDKNGDGYVRSESVNVLFLQRAKDANRIYTEICHVKGKYFSKPDSTFLPTRNSKDLQKFFEEFYRKIKINPDDVEYIEANAPGIPEADLNELEAISQVFGKNHPVKIGCIKSNLGHTESSSGVVGISKLCLAYQRGELPANINFTEPLDLPAIRENKLQVVTDNTSFNRGYTAINNFGYSGANFHALLKCPYIAKDTDRYNTEIPRLVLVSGRTEEGLNKVFDFLENNPIDPEQIALMNNIFKHNIPGHTGRGFAIFDNKENEPRNALTRGFEYYSGNKRPVCFMYSGMGSQWAGMGAQLMQIPIFVAAIEKCQKVLDSKGLDLVDIITNPNYDIANQVLYSLTGITAVQIGLTDVLKAMGVMPDLIIGHSLGEIACSYADGSLTAEEALLVSYNRGLVSAETKFIKGKMAAIGLGNKEVGTSCPDEVDIACHNSSISTTISGPADAVDKFVETLVQRDIFARIVASSDIAFHSRYIAEAGPKLLSLLHEVIKEPKQRSKKWLSTCYVPEEWDLEQSQLASAEYFTHNLLSKVLFEEAAKNIPHDAIIIEIAPYGLLQAILKKSHASCLNLALLKRNNDQNLKFLLESIGKLYQNGLNPDIDVLYPKVNFPVSTETPGLSHLVDWEHSVEWDVNYYMGKTSKHAAVCAQFVLSVCDNEYSFIRNYVRNGENIFAESFLLVLVWKTLAMYKEVNHTDLPVEFKNVKFHDHILATSEGNMPILELRISIQKGSNNFEVTLEEKVVVDGYINVIDSIEKDKTNAAEFDYNQTYLEENSVYKLLNMHGYNLRGDWLSIKATNLNICNAVIEWYNDWTFFLESLLQLNILSESEYTPRKIAFISSLHIDVKNHIKSIICDDKNGKQYVYANRNAESGEILCGGVICKSIFLTKLPLKLTTNQMFTQKFVSHFCNYPVDVKTAINVNLQIVFENSPNEILKVTFVKTERDNDILNIVKDTMSVISTFSVELHVIESNDVLNVNLNTETTDVVICTDVWNSKILQRILREKPDSKFFVMLIKDKKGNDFNYLANNGITFITSFDVDDKEILLVKKYNEVKLNLNHLVISPSLDHLKSELQKESHNIIYILENNTCIKSTGYRDRVKKLLKKGITVFLLDLQEVPLLPLSKNIFLKKQIEKGLSVNILRNEQSWGGYYHVPLKSNVEVSNFELTAHFNSFDGLEWTESPTINDCNRVEVHYSGIVMKDYKDLLNDSKMSNFGMDYSGVDSNGIRIMGCVSGGSIASLIPSDPNLLWPVPIHWSLEDAATVPLPYVHAYYCLTIKYPLLRKSTVLVTGAAGALGQALISLCLSLNCKVYATVSSKRKKQLLRKLFPEIKENHIEFSTNPEFGDNIRNSSNGKRCTVVINCYSGKIRQAAMDCVAEAGTFLDLSQDDMKENKSFGFGYMLEGRHYVTVRLSSIFTEENNNNKKKLQAVVAEGIAKGVVKPMTRVVYPMSHVSKAFELMSERKPVGRILVNLKDKECQQIVEPRLQLNHNKIYLVVWDGSEIGVEIINRLIRRGAKTLILNKWQKSVIGYYEAKYAIWKKSVKIELNHENLNTTEGCERFIKNAIKMGPVDGLFIVDNNFHIDDCIENNSGGLVVSNLDFATREIKSLRYFVCISLRPHSVSDTMFAATEEYFMKREKLGLPSLHFVCKLKEMDFSLKTVLSFLNGFEKSLNQKYSNILLTDSDLNKHILGGIETDNITKHKSKNKLNVLIDDIEKEETEATEVMISINTLISQVNSDELLLDPNEDMAIVISGFLGNYEKFTKSTRRLKISAYGLQIAPDLEGSILDLAKYLLKIVKMRFKLKSKFYLVAHSFGVNIALEIAALMEKEGLYGIIFCLDSSPLALQQQIKTYLGNLSKDQLQNSIIEHIYTLLVGYAPVDLKKDLEDCNNWSDKASVFINNIKNKVSHTHQYLNDLINAIYKRVHLAMAYKPDLKLNSEIVLIKGLPDPKIDTLPNDYDLAKYTSKPIKVINLASDYVSLPNDPYISTIINGMLEPELLELYEKKNLCEVYFD